MTREIQKKKQALIDFLEDSGELMMDNIIDMRRRNLPPEWDQVDLDAKVDPKKAKLTLWLDEDIIKYFRAMGPGYGKMVNRVLRTFVMGRIANVLFVRENAIDLDELTSGYRNKSFAELQDWVRDREKMKDQS